MANFYSGIEWQLMLDMRSYYAKLDPEAKKWINLYKEEALHGTYVVKSNDKDKSKSLFYSRSLLGCIKKDPPRYAKFKERMAKENKKRKAKLSPLEFLVLDQQKLYNREKKHRRKDILTVCTFDQKNEPLMEVVTNVKQAKKIFTYSFTLAHKDGDEYKAYNFGKGKVKAKDLYEAMVIINYKKKEYLEEINQAKEKLIKLAKATELEKITSGEKASRVYNHQLDNMERMEDQDDSGDEAVFARRNQKLPLFVALKLIEVLDNQKNNYRFDVINKIKSVVLAWNDKEIAYWQICEYLFKTVMSTKAFINDPMLEQLERVFREVIYHPKLQKMRVVNFEQ